MSGYRCERLVDRYQPPDWHSRNSSLVDGARTSRDRSTNLRKDAQMLKLETDTRTKWHNYENNMKLSRRATDIEHWRKQLEKVLKEVNAEISVLSNAKEACERALEAKALPSDVVTECLSIREVRRQFEVVRDPVEHSLNAEAKLISQIRAVLKDKCETAFSRLSDLEEVRRRLEIDLQDKTEALKIDLDQLELTQHSSGLSLKPDPTNIPKNSVQPEAWEDHSARNKAEAELLLVKSQHLREDIYHTVEQTNNDLTVQIDATNFDFRKRMYEMKRAKEELEYQIRKTEEEMDQQENTMRDLEVALKAKENPLKLAETRLENRKVRPHMELCSDIPMDGLIDEVSAIRESMQMLDDKLEHSRETLTELQQRRKDLSDDHQRKSQAFSLDQKCMGVREKLGGVAAATSQTDRNLKLTGTLRNTSRFLENSTVSTN